MKKFSLIFLLTVFFVSCSGKTKTSLTTPKSLSSVSAVWSPDDKAVVISWKLGSSNTEKVLIERSDNGANYKPLSKSLVRKNNFKPLLYADPSSGNVKDTKIKDGVTYRYRLTAINGKGYSKSITTDAVTPTDVFPPETFLDVKTKDGSARAYFTFHGTDGNNGYVFDFECKLDNGLWEKCTPPFEDRTLSDGSHKFQVRAIDKVGNVDPTPAEYTWTIEKTAWKMVSAGRQYTCGIDSEDHLFCWGNGGSGRLGLGNTNTYTYPKKIGNDKWSSVAVYYHHTCGIKSDGTLWCWGYNNFGQLGINDTLKRSSPVEVGNSTDWKSVAVGTDHTCAIKGQGELWCWGRNNKGQLGKNNTSDYHVPVKVNNGNDDWKSLSLGFQHSCATKGTNELWCWGLNNFGQLGINSTADHEIIPKQVPGNWKTLSVGFYFSCGIKDNGELWCWGRNDMGQLARNNFSSNQLSPVQIGSSSDWAAIDATDNFACGIKSSDLVCWGNNTNRQLGVESDSDKVYTPVTVSTANNISQLSLGFTFSCKIQESRLYCWGNNYQYGMLGIGENEDMKVPTKSSIEKPKVIAVSKFNSYSCSIDNKDKLYSWGIKGSVSGNNISDSGQLGIGPSDVSYYNNPQAVLADFNWSKVSLGKQHSCGILSDGTLLCWGSNIYGQLGTGNYTTYYSPETVGTDKDWSIISLGESHSCGIRDGEKLFCWGNNSYGKIGNGTYVNYNTPQAILADFNWKKVSLGQQHTCGILTDGTLLCWGYNGFGQLGTGDYNTYKSPETVESGSHWNQVSSGYYHTCGIKTDGTLWCWGYNSMGQLGIGFYSYREKSPKQVGNDTDWSFVSSGLFHTCALKNDSSLYCWGDDSHGDLGINSIYANYIPKRVHGLWKSVSAGNMTTCGINKDDNLSYCWGYNKFGQLGIVERPWRLIPQIVDPKFFE